MLLCRRIASISHLADFVNHSWSVLLGHGQTQYHPICVQIWWQCLRWEENFDKLMAIYAIYIQTVFRACAKTLFCWRGVLTRMQKMFGENLGFLLKESKIFSLSNTGIITMFHPEAYLNPLFRGNNFKTGCRYLDDLWTEVLIYLTSNKTTSCILDTCPTHLLCSQQSCVLYWDHYLVNLSKCSRINSQRQWHFHQVTSKIMSLGRICVT